MNTRSSTVAAALAETGWLATLVVVPLFFNPLTVRIFEEEKVYLLRSIALLVAPALLIWTVEHGRSALLPGGRPFWRLPLIRPALVLTAVYVAATAVSELPSASFWGAYARSQGTYTWLCYMVVFAAIVLLVRRREQLDRIVSAILLASIPVAVYAVLQHFGHDPIVWETLAMDRSLASGPVLRSHSTAGNPIFLAAYLIMVVPLALARLVEELSRTRQFRLSQPSLHQKLASALLIGCYAILVALHLLAIVYSRSRGPFVGLCAGFVYFSIVLSVRRGWRWLSVVTAATTGAAALFLFAFNLMDTRLETLREVPYLGRFADVESGTGQVRILIWQGATDLLRGTPRRLLLGHGPETMLWVFAPFVPPQLAHYEQRHASPDRAHNETFDALITIGIAGFLAQLAVLFSFVVCGLRWLGVLATRRQAVTFLAAGGLGGFLGAAIPSLAIGSLWVAGVGLPAGIVIGFLSYLLWLGITGAKAPPRGIQPRDLLLIGLMSAVMAHFVETHFGIAITVTRLYFWTYAALAVVVGVPLLRRATEEDTLPQPSDGATFVNGTLVALSTTVGLILVLLTFGFYRADLEVAREGWGLTSILAGPWIVGGLLITLEAETRRNWLARLGIYGASTAGILLLFVAFFLPWANWIPVVRELSPQVVSMLAIHQSRGVAILYAAVFFTVVLGAVALSFQDHPSPTKFYRRRWGLVLAPCLLAAAILLGTRTNLDASRADALSKRGLYYEGVGRPDVARLVYREALQRRPNEEIYLTSLGRTLIENSRLGKATERQDLVEAVAAMERGQEINPLNVDHPRNLGRAHRTWARLSAEPETARKHLEQADAHYEHAVTLAPHNVALRNEWATLHLETGQTQRALEILARSLEIDERHATTYWLRANAHLIAGDLEAALRGYDETLAIDAFFLAAFSGKTVTQHRMGRLHDAVATGQDAIVLAPNDMLSRRNLALLYLDAGRPRLALPHAEVALRLAADADRPPIEALVSDLRQSVQEDANAEPGTRRSPRVRTVLGLRSHSRPVQIKEPSARR